MPVARIPASFAPSTQPDPPPPHTHIPRMRARPRQPERRGPAPLRQPKLRFVASLHTTVRISFRWRDPRGRFYTPTRFSFPRGARAANPRAAPPTGLRVAVSLPRPGQRARQSRRRRVFWDWLSCSLLASCERPDRRCQRRTASPLSRRSWRA